jgi:hypothetical protein
VTVIWTNMVLHMFRYRTAVFAVVIPWHGANFRTD